MGVERSVVVAVRRQHPLSFRAILLAMTASGLLAAKGRERRLDLAAQCSEQSGLAR